MWFCYDGYAQFIMVLHCIYVFSIVDYIDFVFTMLMPLFGYPAVSAASVSC